jgi:hypothetical protein
MGGKGMAERMRRHPLDNPRPANHQLDNLPNPRPGELPAEAVGENRRTNDTVPRILKIVKHRLFGEAADRHEPLFLPFAGDADETRFELTILLLEIDQFGYPKATAVQDLNYGPIPFGVLSERIGGLDDRLNVAG